MGWHDVTCGNSNCPCMAGELNWDDKNLKTHDAAIRADQREKDAEPVESYRVVITAQRGGRTFNKILMALADTIRGVSDGRS